MSPEDKERLIERAKVFFESYLNLVVVTRGEPDNKSLRKGQAYFQVLEDVRPDIANRVRGTRLDPYYQTDNNITDFLYYVHKNW